MKLTNLKIKKHHVHTVKNINMYECELVAWHWAVWPYQADLIKDIKNPHLNHHLNYMYRSVLCFGQRTLLKPQRAESLSQIDISVRQSLLLSDGHMHASKQTITAEKSPNIKVLAEWKDETPSHTLPYSYFHTILECDIGGESEL